MTAIPSGVTQWIVAAVLVAVAGLPTASAEDAKDPLKPLRDAADESYNWLRDTAEKYTVDRLPTGEPANTVELGDAPERAAAPDRLADGRIVIIIPNSSAGEEKINAVFTRDVVVGRGSTVVWINQDNMRHNVRSMSTSGNQVFYSGYLETGDSFEHTFNQPGTYVFVCPMHPWRSGTVTVQ